MDYARPPEGMLDLTLSIPVTMAMSCMEVNLLESVERMVTGLERSHDAGDVSYIKTMVM